MLNKCYGVFTPEQDNDKTTIRKKVEPVPSYDAFHTRHVGPSVKGIIGMHRFNICLVVVLLWCENTITLTAQLLLLNAQCYDKQMVCLPDIVMINKCYAYRTLL